ncbi:hypothetical protein AVEN_125566-1 [Araneus ventricosus]|uniref:Uncharacterized protein n=1 Tax=Araneus ventricosus TaxID=182803 RepID=A0A4Y2NEQ6_ARAVE|nr:hypothetical protein AVEN_125566-1 [Araneus ventricosus]
MPSVSLRPTNCIREDVIFFSEHGPFPAYLKRFHLSDSNQLWWNWHGISLCHGVCPHNVLAYDEDSPKLRTRMAKWLSRQKPRL